MSKLIFCTGDVAVKPYYFKLTDINIYSIEELCYYIFNNIYSIDEGELNEALANWIKEELHLIEQGEALQRMIKDNASLKEIVKFLLGSSSYYTESELEYLMKIISEIEDYPKIYRQKLKADNFLKYKNYSNAIIEYESIIKNTENTEKNFDFLGNIWHNIGVINGRMMDYAKAGEAFMKAYRLNDNKESLKQYIYVMYLSKSSFSLDNDSFKGLLDDATYNEVIYSIEEMYRQAETEEAYLYIQKAIKAKETGHISEYYRRIDKIINSWKNEYRYQTLR